MTPPVAVAPAPGPQPDARSACPHTTVDLRQPDPDRPDRVIAACLACGAVALVRFSNGEWHARRWVDLDNPRPG